MPGPTGRLRLDRRFEREFRRYYVSARSRRARPAPALLWPATLRALSLDDPAGRANLGHENETDGSNPLGPCRARLPADCRIGGISGGRVSDRRARDPRVDAADVARRS